MKIEWIRIKGFRNFDDETINLQIKLLLLEQMMLENQI